MYRRIPRVKKITTSNSSFKNNVINSAIFVSFIVVVLAPNVISVSYDDGDNISEARAGTIGMVDYQTLIKNMQTKNYAFQHQLQ